MKVDIGQYATKVLNCMWTQAIYKARSSYRYSIEDTFAVCLNAGVQVCITKTKVDDKNGTWTCAQDHILTPMPSHYTHAKTQCNWAYEHIAVDWLQLTSAHTDSKLMSKTPLLIIITSRMFWPRGLFQLLTKLVSSWEDLQCETFCCWTVTTDTSLCHGNCALIFFSYHQQHRASADDMNTINKFQVSSC